MRLLASQPDLIQRIPQYQSASYIGVTPESLSRIRKRMVTKKWLFPNQYIIFHRNFHSLKMVCQSIKYDDCQANTE